MVDQTLRVMLIGLLSLVQMKRFASYVRITLHIRLHIQFVRMDKALQTFSHFPQIFFFRSPDFSLVH